MAYNSDIHLNRIDDEVTSRLGAINAIYRGTIDIDFALVVSATATITSVTTGRSVLTNLGWHMTSSTGVIASSRVELTNATTVTAYAQGMSVSGGNSAGASGGVLRTGYQVVEYAA